MFAQGVVLYSLGRTQTVVSRHGSKDRENAITKQYGAVFIIGIGGQLGDGKKHDGRAPDYDDYSSKGLNGYPGLNGDLLLWNDVLQRAIELSSIGIRVDKEALVRQLKEEGEKDLIFTSTND